jgi:hypothetical protein
MSFSSFSSLLLLCGLKPLRSKCTSHRNPKTTATMQRIKIISAKVIVAHLPYVESVIIGFRLPCFS